MKETLYHLTSEYTDILKTLDNETVTPEELETAKQALDSIADDINTKIKNIALYILSLNRQQEVCEAEAKRLINRAKSFGNTANWLKDYITINMKATGAKAVKTDVVNVFLQKSPPSVVEADVNLLEAKFTKTIPEHKEANRQAIIEWFRETGEIPAGAKIVTDNTYIKIT